MAFRFTGAVVSITKVSLSSLHRYPQQLSSIEALAQMSDPRQPAVTTIWVGQGGRQAGRVPELHFSWIFFFFMFLLGWGEALLCMQKVAGCPWTASREESACHSRKQLLVLLWQSPRGLRWHTMRAGLGFRDGSKELGGGGGRPLC